MMRFGAVVGLLVLLVCGPAAAAGDAEFDRDVGICAGYLAMREAPQSRIVAVARLASNRARAEHFGRAWIEGINRSQVPELRLQAGADHCRRIGVRV